ncbi:hypothetical protein S7711_11622, partial [Stachybotrys chartarum IBT 7711]
HKDGKDNGYYPRRPSKDLGKRTGPFALTNKQIVELEEAKEDRFDDDIWIIGRDKTTQEPGIAHKKSDFPDQGDMKNDGWVKIPEPPKSSPNGKARIAMLRRSKSWVTCSSAEEDVTQQPDEIPDRQPTEPEWDWEARSIEENCRRLRNLVNGIANDIDVEYHNIIETLGEPEGGMKLTSPHDAMKRVDDIPVRARGSAPVIARSPTTEEQRRARHIARMYQDIHTGQRTDRDVFYVHGRAAWQIKTEQVYLTHTWVEGDRPELSPTNPEHYKIAWVSCFDHDCQTHELQKIVNNCYPERLSGVPITGWYRDEELRQFRTERRVEGDVAILVRRKHPFPKECLESRTHEGCKRPECRIHDVNKIQEWHEAKNGIRH